MAEVLARVSDARRPAHRPVAHGPHGAGGQHLEHAGRRARGVGLPRRHHRRVLPRHGLPRGADGRQPVALGRGAARDRRAPAGDARARRATPPTSPAGSASSTSAPAGCARSAAPSARAPLTLISAISPPGGDFSEPVTQATLRVAGALWALDADARAPAPVPGGRLGDELLLYAERTRALVRSARSDADWPDAAARRRWSCSSATAELRDIAGLVGPEALQDADRLVLEVGAAGARGGARPERVRPERARSSPGEDVPARTAGRAARAHRARPRAHRGRRPVRASSTSAPCARALVGPARRARPAELAAASDGRRGRAGGHSAAEARP